MTTPPSAVPAWTATGHQLSWVDTQVDRRQEQLLDDVVPDEWISPARRSQAPTNRKAPASTDRPAVAVLL